MKDLSKMSKGLRYYYRNRELLIEKNKNYTLAHPEKLKASQKKYALSAKGIYNCIKTTRNYKNHKLVITKDEFVTWYNECEKKCTYCGVLEKNLNYQSYLFSMKLRTNRLTIDRKDNNKLYTKNNIVLACDLCNRTKSSIFTFVEMLAIGEIIQKRY